MRGGVAGGHLRGGLGGIDVPDANYGHRGTTLDRYLLAARALGAFVQPSFIWADFALGMEPGFTTFSSGGASQGRPPLGEAGVRSCWRFNTGTLADYTGRAVCTAKDAHTITGGINGESLYMACGFRIASLGHFGDVFQVGALDSGGGVFNGIGLTSSSGFDGGRYQLQSAGWSASGALGESMLAPGGGDTASYTYPGVEAASYLVPSPNRWHALETWWSGPLNGPYQQRHGFRVDGVIHRDDTGSPLYAVGTRLPMIYIGKQTQNTLPTVVDLAWALWVFEGAGQ